MFSRRHLFSLLPLGALGLSAPEAKAETPKESEPSVWVEFTCQNTERTIEVHGYARPACGQRFKVLRALLTPVCPKCGWAYCLTPEEYREKLAGIPC